MNHVTNSRLVSALKTAVARQGFTNEELINARRLLAEVKDPSLSSRSTKPDRDRPATPITDAEEARQRQDWNLQSEIDWPGFPADFGFARKLEVQRDQLAKAISRARYLLAVDSDHCKHDQSVEVQEARDVLRSAVTKHLESF